MADEAEGASGTDATNSSEATASAATIADAASQAEGTTTETGESYTVKVGGEEQNVSLQELREGFMRHSDYTQKTQALSETSRRVETLDRFEQQLDADPEATLTELADAYGVSLDQAAQAVTSDSGEELSDEQAQIKELTDRVSAQEAKAVDDDTAQAMAQVDADLEALKVDNDDAELDETAVLQIAVDEGVGNLEAAYLLYRNRTPKPESSKPPVVEGGSTTVAPASGGSNKMTLEQAMAAAEASLAS